MIAAVPEDSLTNNVNGTGCGSGLAIRTPVNSAALLRSNASRLWSFPRAEPHVWIRSPPSALNGNSQSRTARVAQPASLRA